MGGDLRETKTLAALKRASRKGFLSEYGAFKCVSEICNIDDRILNIARFSCHADFDFRCFQLRNSLTRQSEIATLESARQSALSIS